MNRILLLVFLSGCQVISYGQTFSDLFTERLEEQQTKTYNLLNAEVDLFLEKRLRRQ